MYVHRVEAEEEEVCLLQDQQVEEEEEVIRKEQAVLVLAVDRAQSPLKLQGRTTASRSMPTQQEISCLP